ncbi:MAG: TetR/AcrR family transcriptional regulator [Synechococcales cyanobacterium RM1_1_8]|nr:TetR/AcrR family transcriptional regulator [Synechococcales cyanobacterium RM1_1_8]
MPSPTFFNLPDPKRQRIVELAIAEFASHDYDSASITMLVKQAKIAKGSLYQYFEDKKDLYLYLVDLAAQQKLAFFKEAESSQPEAGFFCNCAGCLMSARSLTWRIRP